MDERIWEIRKHLKKKLNPFRYEHILGVSFTCQALAMRYGFDLGQAEMAGLLHDCAKRYENTVLTEKCIKYGIPIRPSEEEDPSLLHAKLGAWMAREKYGVEDEEILNAIQCHTTGRVGMTALDKILYVADYIEPRRYKAADLPQMRQLAFLDLDQACLRIMESILEYLRSQNCSIDPLTIQACDDMKRIVREQEAHQEIQTQNKEEHLFEAVKRTGKNCSRSVGRQKRRRHQNYRH